MGCKMSQKAKSRIYQLVVYSGPVTDVATGNTDGQADLVEASGRMTGVYTLAV